MRLLESSRRKGRGWEGGGRRCHGRGHESQGEEEKRKGRCFGDEDEGLHGYEGISLASSFLSFFILLNIFSKYQFEA